MKLFRFGEPGREKPGVIVNNNVKLDVSGFGEDYGESFFSTQGIDRLQKWLSVNEKTCSKVGEEIRIGPAIVRPSKIICIGLNYADHAKETNTPIPQEPIIFFKATTALCGPNDDVIIPPNATKLDWEVELAVVIKKEAKFISETDALDYVAGYVLHNDYSEREFQLERGGQWVKGKSFDTFAPMGPFLATPDEFNDINNLLLWLKVNNIVRQQSNTKNLIFNIPYIIHYLSHFMTLIPGDVISTGTPPGVGLGLNPPVFLKEGDVVELGIEGLGFATQRVANFKKRS